MVKNKSIRKIQNHIPFDIIIISVIIFLLGISSMGVINSHFLGNDAFGYISNAASLNGYSWQIADLVDYYAWGYSLLLAPLIFFAKTPQQFFSLISILNSFILSSIFVLSFLFCNELFEKLHRYQKVCISALVTLYIGNISSANLYVSDILVVCIFWGITYTLVRVSNKSTFLNCAVLAVLISSSYLSHKRTIGVVISVCIVMCLLLIYKKISVKHFLCFLLILFAIFFIGIIIFDKVVSGYISGTDYSVSSNTPEAAIDNFKALLTDINFFINVLTAVASQVFYLFISTYHFAIFGIAVCIMFVCRSIKQKYILKKDLSCNYDYTVNWSIPIFLLLSLLSTLFITSMKIPIPGRADVVTFGRYTEFLAGPLIIYALAYIVQYYKEEKNVIWNIGYHLAIISLLLVFVVQYRYSISAYRLTWFDTVSSIGYSIYWNLGFSYLKSAMIVSLISLNLLFLLTRDISEILRKFLFIALTLVFCCISFIQYNFVMQNPIKNALEEEALVEKIDLAIVDAGNESIVYVGSDYSRDMILEELQMLNPEKEIYFILYEDINDFSLSDNFIYMIKESYYDDELWQNFEIIDNIEDRYLLLTKSQKRNSVVK